MPARGMDKNVEPAIDLREAGFDILKESLFEDHFIID
jgi:hypothetical protein